MQDSAFSASGCGGEPASTRARTFELLLGSLGDGVIAIDAPGKPIFANAAAARILRKPLAGTPLPEWPQHYGLYLPDKATLYPPAQLPLARAAAGAAVENVDVFLRTNNEPEGVWLNWRAWPLINGAGPAGAVAVFRDVTGDRSVGDRLRKSQVMEAVGKLAGGVAHDFNNLLMIISGYAEILAESLPATDPELSPVEEIQKAVNRAASLVGELLNFGQRHPVQPRPLSLNEAAVALREPLRKTLGDSIDVSMMLDPRLEPVHADPSLIEQVVWSLALNARDAMPRGGRLTIRTANAELSREDTRGREILPGAYATLVVSDTGIGMDDHVRAHLFEPFFTTKAFGGRSGLALSSVYGIVRQAGGDIHVSSELGRGATFEIHLPRFNSANGKAGHGD
jgi:signal transduction histidine kinase